MIERQVGYRDLSAATEQKLENTNMAGTLCKRETDTDQFLQVSVLPSATSGGTVSRISRTVRDR
jgi:hypothetical protein